MSYWRSLMGLVTGASWRQRGQQSGSPQRYGQASATPVTVDSALQLSAVWACARLYAETIGSMPIFMYEKKADGTRTKVTEHPIVALLNGKMNRWQTRQEFFESITYQLILGGNNYAVKQENAKKELIGLVPLMSEQMIVDLQKSGDITYTYRENSDITVYSSQKIWHNKLFGNGIIGLSPLGYARNSIGIGQAAENSVGKIYSNGGKPSGLLTIDKVLTDEQRKAIKKNFADMAEGTEDRLFVLEAGMAYAQVSLSPQDIELLASRRFQIEDIARFFGVPSVLINDTQATTAWGSGIQQIVEGFYKLNLRPYLERYEASMAANLLTPEERLKFEFEFDFDALVIPNLQERRKAGKEAVTGGLITPNEYRLEEGRQPLPGGENLFLQQQMTPVNQLDQIDRTKTSAPAGSMA